jgi:pyruvate,water dikinase
VTRAIITETGGILSHAAVTAREYGIPAVMGVSNATRIIRDGQMLEVDGSEGTVRIVS